MLTGIFSIFDVKADMYATPFFMPTNGMAIRAFADLANDGNSSISKHPGDYKLVRVGSFDDSNGAVIKDAMESLGFASDYVTRPSEVVALPVGKAG